MKVLLVIYDNGAVMHWFPQGMAYVASALLDAGHEVEIYNQDMYHYPDEHLTQCLNKNKFDVIGISVTAGYWQYKKLLGISKAINASKNRPFFVIGGHGPTPDPEFFIKKTGADAVAMGEGELTVVELMKAVAGDMKFADVKGIAFKDGEEVIINERRPLIKDVNSISFPAYHIFPMEYYRLLRKPHAGYNDFVMSVLSGRGCPYKCTFCYRMDEGFRPRSSEGIIEEIKMLKKDYGINYIDFYDELLLSSVERTRQLCEDFIKEDINIKWMCQGRLNFAKPELLKLMKRAGCVFVNYGIESLDNNVLKNMRKGLTDKIIEEGITATIESGMSPGLNMMFGNVGDTKETLRRSVDFLIKYDDGAQIRTIKPVVPYPGTEMYYNAIEKGLIRDCEDFYENKHLNSDRLSCNFTNMSGEEFYNVMLEANTILIKDHFEHISNMHIEAHRKLYMDGDINFRGVRS